MDLDSIADLLRDQDGVVARRQVVDRGGTGNDLARLVRRRELTRVHDGVFVDHNGPLSDRQRAWAAVLAHWPSVLCGAWSLAASGLRVASLPPRVEVAVAHQRRVGQIEGVVVRRIRRLEAVARWDLSPPRTRLEHAVLCVAARAPRDDTAVAVISDACQSRRTTTTRLAQMLDQLPRLTRRAFLREVLDDVRTGLLRSRPGRK